MEYMWLRMLGRTSSVNNDTDSSFVINIERSDELPDLGVEQVGLGVFRMRMVEDQP